MFSTARRVVYGKRRGGAWCRGVVEMVQWTSALALVETEQLGDQCTLFDKIELHFQLSWTGTSLIPTSYM